MTRFECAIVLLELLSKFASVNGAVSMDKVEAVARGYYGAWKRRCS